MSHRCTACGKLMENGPITCPECLNQAKGVEPIGISTPDEPVWTKVCSCQPAPALAGTVSLPGTNIAIGGPICPHCRQGYLPTEMTGKCIFCGGHSYILKPRPICFRCHQLECLIKESPEAAVKILRAAGLLPVESPAGRDDAGFEVEDKESSS